MDDSVIKVLRRNGSWQKSINNQEKKRTFNSKVNDFSLDENFGVLAEEIKKRMKNKSFKKYSKKAKSDSLILRLKNIPKGNYAISLYQDINSHNVCNLSFAGIPKEPFGFSNNYKPFLKKPSFKDCQFSLQKDTYTYTVN